MKEIYHFEDLDVEGRIMLRWILRIWDGKVRTGVVWFGIEARFCKHWMNVWIP
jgi:hypothetical protein